MTDSKSKNYHGIPRDQIDWFPSIDEARCVSCLACVSFCKNNVYAEENGKSKVKNPLNCVVVCTGCEKVCPVSAISHPPKEYLVELLKKRYDENGEK